MSSVSGFLESSFPVASRPKTQTQESSTNRAAISCPQTLIAALGTFLSGCYLHLSVNRIHHSSEIFVVDKRLIVFLLVICLLLFYH